MCRKDRTEGKQKQPSIQRQGDCWQDNNNLLSTTKYVSVLLPEQCVNGFQDNAVKTPLGFWLCKQMNSLGHNDGNQWESAPASG